MGVGSESGGGVVKAETGCLLMVFAVVCAGWSGLKVGGGGSGLAV